MLEVSPVHLLLITSILYGPGHLRACSLGVSDALAVGKPHKPLYAIITIWNITRIRVRQIGIATTLEIKILDVSGYLLMANAIRHSSKRLSRLIEKLSYA
jgi:hypothetical protein